MSHMSCLYGACDEAVESLAEYLRTTYPDKPDVHLTKAQCETITDALLKLVCEREPASGAEKKP